MTPTRSLEREPPPPAIEGTPGGVRRAGGGWHVPLAAAALTAAARSVVALSRLDEQELELYSGTLAWALLNGMPLDPAQLPVIPHNRGSVVIGLLLVPLFWLLGPTLGAIKVLAVGLSAATAALFAHVLGRHAGRTAAWAGALLYALLPPSFQVVDVLALGSHGDSLLPTLGALALLLAWGARPLALPRAVLLGTLVGFACFFSFQCVVALPALLAVWLALDRAFWRRAGSLVAALSALVWIPIASWLVPSGEGATIVGQSPGDRFLPDGAGGAVAKLGRTLAHELRASWLYEHHGGAWASWLALAGLAAGAVAGLAALRVLPRAAPLALFCVAYPALVVGAYAASNFEMKLEENLDGMGSRYLMPVLPFLAALVALGAEGLARRGRPALARLLAAPPLVTGAAGLLALAEPLRAAGQPTVRGTELPLFHGHVETAGGAETGGGADLARRLEWVRRVEPDWPDLQPLAYRVFARPDWGERAAGGLLAAVAEERETPLPLRGYVLCELGRALAERDPALGELARAIAGWTEDERRAVLSGLGTAWLGRVVARTSRRLSVDPTGERTFAGVLDRLRALDPDARGHVLAGMGFQLGYRLTAYQPALLRALSAAGATLEAPEERARFFEAVGRGYRLRFREEGYAPPGELRIEPSLGAGDARAAFRAGLER